MQDMENQGQAFWKRVCGFLVFLSIYVWQKAESYKYCNANSEVAASLKAMIILFNILIIIIQGTFQRRHLTTEEKMTLWS